MEQVATGNMPDQGQQFGDLQLAHGQIHMPVFMPDATLGVVRSVDATDLATCEIQAVVMNTFHLMQRPGSSTIHALGGYTRRVPGSILSLPIRAGFKHIRLFSRMPDLDQ